MTTLMRTLYACLVTTLALLPALLPTAYAAEFRSLGDAPAILFDSPSARGEKRFVLGSHHPLEVLVKLEAFTKVREPSGEVGWIDNKAWGRKRYVIVTADGVELKDAADDRAKSSIGVARGVLVEVLEITTPSGWLKVAHRDGASGFVRIAQIWGA